MQVPAEVSIVRYDDIELAAYVDPPLTTLRNPMKELGELAIELLLRDGTGDQGSVSRRLTGVLVPRNSTGPAPVQQVA